MVSQIPVSPRYWYPKKSGAAIRRLRNTPLRGSYRLRNTPQSFLLLPLSPNIRRGGENKGRGILKTREDIEDESERLLERRKADLDAKKEDNDSGEQDDGQAIERDVTDSYEEVIFGRRRPDSAVVDWANKVLFVLEFKRTSDQRRDYRKWGEARARNQHDILIKSLEKVAEDADGGENKGWKIKLVIFVGGTCGSVNVKSFNNNMNELHVIESVESKRNTIRKGLAFELMNAQDAVLCSYFAQRSGERNEHQNPERRSTLAAQKKKWEGEDDGAAAGKIQGRHEGVVEKVRTQGLATPGLGVATRPVIGGGNGGQGPAEMPGAG